MILINGIIEILIDYTTLIDYSKFKQQDLFMILSVFGITHCLLRAQFFHWIESVYPTPSLDRDETTKQYQERQLIGEQVYFRCISIYILIFICYFVYYQINIVWGISVDAAFERSSEALSRGTALLKDGHYFTGVCYLVKSKIWKVLRTYFVFANNHAFNLGVNWGCYLVSFQMVFSDEDLRYRADLSNADRVLLAVVLGTITSVALFIYASFFNYFTFF